MPPNFWWETVGKIVEALKLTDLRLYISRRVGGSYLKTEYTSSKDLFALDKTSKAILSWSRDRDTKHPYHLLCGHEDPLVIHEDHEVCSLIEVHAN